MRWYHYVNHIFRIGNDNGFIDRTFENQMNHLIRLTEHHYEQTHYKDALKTGFFEYQMAKDNYKQFCGSKDSALREDLIFRFIETQAIILSPICPHIAEKIWKTIGKEGLIVNAKWPATDPVDEILVKELDFLNKSVHEFRIRKENKFHPKKSKKEIHESVIEPKAKATIYVNEQHPEWKIQILKVIKELYDMNNGVFPDNRTIAQYLKEFGKEAMPFVQTVRQKYEDGKKSEFRVEETWEFNQRKVFESMRDYLLTTLQLEKISFVDICSQDAPEEIAKTCSPGAPLIMFDV